MPTGLDRIEMPDGSFRGVQILDEDVKPGQHGRETLARLESQLGPLPVTLTARSASGGRHFYFEANESLERVSTKPFGKAAGLDWLREGCQVVFPGSEISDAYAEEKGCVAGRYEWIDRSVPVACLPAAWEEHLRMLAMVTPRDVSSNSPTPIDITSEDGQLLWLEAVAYCEQDAPVATKGQHGQDACFDVAGHLVKRFRLSHEDAKDLMLGVWSLRCDPPSSWSERNIDRKLSQAREARQFPEWGIGWSQVRCERARTRIKATSKGLRPGKTASRRLKQPGHKYTFFPGVDSSAMCPVKPEVDTLTNTSRLLAVHEDWAGVLQWDELHNRVVAVDPPMQLDAETKGLTKYDVTAIRMWLECHGVLLQKNEARDVIERTSKKLPFHPVKEWLESLPRYSGRFVSEHLETRPLGVMAERAFRVNSESQPLAQTFWAKTLVAAVRRVFNPGIKHDPMLVLCGPQDKLKSTSFDVLFAPWFRDDMPEIDSGKEVSMAFRGYWAVEFQEVDQWKNKQKGKLKKVLSTRTERFRGFGVEDSLEEHRQVVLLGTTNVEEYLSDETGERRQWPIMITEAIDLAWLKENREAIFADAVALALMPMTGAHEQPVEGVHFNHWLSPEEQTKANVVRDAYQESDPWEGEILNFICNKAEVNVQEVFVHLGTKDAAPNKTVDLLDLTPQLSSRIKKTLLRLGCVGKRHHGGARFYRVPAHKANRLPVTTPSGHGVVVTSAKEVEEEAIRNNAARKLLLARPV